ncbi:MAG: hypothetical protein KGK34_04265 [Chloroflexota bacterium]|nr:hypothetical protein [Chloroflexota bacterium]
MRRTTPGAHPLIRAAWLAAAGLLVVAGLVELLARGRAAIFVLVASVVLFVVSYIAYLVRHLLFLAEVARAERALAAGDLERARALLAPLLDAYPDLAPVQRAAAITLYRRGDPLSAASLLERASRSYADDVEVATTLVASYAALNHGGDARRASGLVPRAVDVRLALAWSELVALGGDRAAGIALAAELADRADVRASPSRRAMAHALEAIAAARRMDAAAAADRLRLLREAVSRLPAEERAFIDYLEAVALRELGRTAEAVAAFERAIDTAPDTIGEALARRERAGLVARLASPSQTEG